MGDNIAIDWNASPSNAFMDGFNNSQKMQDTIQKSQARTSVLSNPGDVNALTKYALFDPQGAQGVMGALDYQRAAQTRQAYGNALAAMAPQSSFAAPGVQASAPQAAPVAPALNAFSPPVAQPPAVGTAPIRSVNVPAAGAQPAQALNQPIAGQPAPPAAPGQPPIAVAPTAPQQQPSAMQNPMHADAVAVGQAAVQGSADPYQALATLARSDPQATQNLIASMSTMDTMQRARMTDSSGALGGAAQSLLAIPQSQRALALQQIAPELAQHGVGPQQIQQALQTGLSDNFLHGIVGQALATKGAVDQANKIVEQGQEQQKIGITQQNADTTRMGAVETARHDKAEEGKGVQDGFGNIVNPTTGQIIYQQGQSAPGDGDINSKIIAAEGAGRNPASSANGPGQFVNSTFRQYIRQASPQIAQQIAGMNDAQLTAYRKANASQLEPIQQQMVRQLTGANQATLTAAGITPTDGNTYMAHVFGAGGTVNAINAGPSAPAAKFVGGMKALTNNGLPATATVGDVQNWASQRIASAGGGNGGTGAGGLTKQAIDAAADLAIDNGGKVPAGYARNKAAQVAIQNRIASRAAELNLTMDQVINKGQDTRAAGKAIQSFTSGKDSTTVQALNNTTQHLVTLRQLGDALQNGDIPTFNRIANAFAKATGQPAPTNYAAAKQIIAGEVVKGIAGAGGGEGDRNQAQTAFDGANSPAQTEGAIHYVKELLQSQANTLRLKYHVATGRDDFDRFLNPSARGAYGDGMPAQIASGGGHSVAGGHLIQHSDGSMEWHP